MDKRAKLYLVFSMVIMMVFSAAAFAQDTTVNVNGSKVDVVVPGADVEIDEDGAKVNASEEAAEEAEDQDTERTDVKAGHTRVKTK